MDAGLWIWDGAGRLMLEGTTRCGRIVGSQRVENGAAGSVVVDLSRGTPFWSFMPDWLFQHISMKVPVPIIDIDANGVRWRYNTTSGDYVTPVPGWLIYGVF